MAEMHIVAPRFSCENKIICSRVSCAHLVRVLSLWYCRDSISFWYLCPVKLKRVSLCEIKIEKLKKSLMYEKLKLFTYKKKKKKRDYKISTKTLSQIANTNLSPINHHFYCIDAIVSVFWPCVMNHASCLTGFMCFHILPSPSQI